MSERHAEGVARIEACEQQARAMIAAAENARTEEAKSELLSLASQWMKLAVAISERLADL